MHDHVMSSGTIRLSVGDRPVADYVWRPQLPLHVSPRPFLHPIRTLSGTEVTELMPRDHRHHLGVSVAVADVGGVNFWGGRTFVPSRGPLRLHNHGAQRHHAWNTRTPTTVVHELRWSDPDGTDLLNEHRRIAVLPVNDQAWALDFAFALTNVTATPLTFASPATNGRPGAGYGGFFWRASRCHGRVQVLGPDRTGVHNLHGRHTKWLAVNGKSATPWTLIFMVTGRPDDNDPWFVRNREYVGVGSSLAWDRPLVVAQGAQLRRRIVTVIVDGRLRSQKLADLASTFATTLGDVGLSAASVR